MSPYREYVQVYKTIDTVCASKWGSAPPDCANSSEVYCQVRARLRLEAEADAETESCCNLLSSLPPP